MRAYGQYSFQIFLITRPSLLLLIELKTLSCENSFYKISVGNLFWLIITFFG